MPYLIASLEQGLEEILTIAGGGFQANQHQLRGNPEIVQSFKEFVEPCKGIGKKGGRDQSLFVPGQATHRTGLHPNIDAHHMGCFVGIGYRRGRF
jgi:hypothetical protein